MRTLDELISHEDDAWPLVEGWIRGAIRPVSILVADREDAEATLHALQVTTHSILGAIALQAGALLIDSGWLRILGAGHPSVGGGLREWNDSIGGRPLDPPLSRALIVAYDVLGGFFAMNGGAWPGDVGTVWYFGPDTRTWESLGVGYPAFVEWSMTSELESFYAGLRWLGWQDEVMALGPDQVISVAPPLGLRFAGDDRSGMDQRSRRAVSARSQWTFDHDIGRQIAELPDGADARFRFED